MKVNIFSLTVQYLDKHCKTWKGQYKAGIREAGVDWTVKYQLHLCCLYTCFWTSWTWNKGNALPYLGLPWCLSDRESTCSAGDQIHPWVGQIPGGGNGSTLQDSCLGNPMDRGVWQATVPGAARVWHDSATKPPPTPRLHPMQHYTVKHTKLKPLERMQARDAVCQTMN